MEVAMKVPKINDSVEVLVFPGQEKKIFVGQEASVGYSDRTPAKVESIVRVKGGWEITLREFAYKAKANPEDIKMGHQDWVILWDQPQSSTTIKIHKDGSIFNIHGGLKVSLGFANPYYCWEI
jgi:hypothetical protein